MTDDQPAAARRRSLSFLARFLGLLVVSYFALGAVAPRE